MCKGNVIINGVNIKNIKIDSLRSQIALVTQDNILFDTSIYENISYGNSYSEESVKKAAEAADADEFISKLPDSYQTNVGVGGFSLSGGQKQRISIARAFLKDAPILILDEATSSLDPASEEKIIESLKESRKNRTTIFITHRLASAKYADQIIVMKDHKICQQGTHQELFKQKGEYHNLYNKHLKGHNDDL